MAKLSQWQLSEKYNVGIGVISACLSGIPYEKVVNPATNRPVRFYEEIDALRAIKQHYDALYTAYMDEVEVFAEKASKIYDFIEKLSE